MSLYFYSTRHQSPSADLRTAVMQGLPDDNGLYMPSEIGRLPDDFFDRLPHLSFADMSFEVAQCLLQDSIEADNLRRIVRDAINFDAPLVPVHDNIACLELFHGPSLAFKDFGARFMARIMAHFVKQSERKLYILVATSGDTGGAVAQGFLGTPGIEVIILYPSGKISHRQEMQLTALGNNIRALEINGTFDDCQQLVKTAFLDTDLRQKLQLSSANSINLARLIPQAFYYVWAYAQVIGRGRKAVFCVPSGNFGNLCAGLLAKKIGLPVHKFVAANNANDVFTTYHHTGIFSPRPSVKTLSNAMDVGNPSNLQRIQDLYGNSLEAINRDIAAYSFSDAQTMECIKSVYSLYNYLMCPHTAVGYLGLTQYFAENGIDKADNYQGIFLGTAHPVKFYDIVEPALGITIPVPESLQVLLKKEKVAHQLGTNFNELKAYLMQLS